VENKKVLITNERFYWVFNVDGFKLFIEGIEEKDYLSNKFKELGYKVKQEFS